MAVELMAPAKTPTGSWVGPEVLGNGLAIGQTLVQMLCCPGGSLSCWWWESRVSGFYLREGKREGKVLLRSRLDSHRKC